MQLTCPGDTNASVALETWRNAPQPLAANGEQVDCRQYMESADVVQKVNGTSVRWYHRNSRPSDCAIGFKRKLTTAGSPHLPVAPPVASACEANPSAPIDVPGYTGVAGCIGLQKGQSLPDGAKSIVCPSNNFTTCVATAAAACEGTPGCVSFSVLDKSFSGEVFAELHPAGLSQAGQNKYAGLRTPENAGQIWFWFFIVAFAAAAAAPTGPQCLPAST